MTGTDIQGLQQKLTEFAKERDWEQFHSPKNIVMALNVEASELLEHFQWLTEEESSQLSEEKLQQVGTEIADVFLYLIRLSQLLNIDIMQASVDKMEENAHKYPAEKVRGSHKKYNEY